MGNGITELVFILDRSGSMGGLESDTIGGFNSMIEKQKKEPGKVYVSTVLFDNRSEVLHDRIKLEDVPLMTEKDYYVRGSTALVDAIGGAIHHIVMENASRHYSSNQIKAMIERQKEAGWEFLFIGANIDAVETAGRYGIRRDRVANYKADRRGTQILYESVSEAVSNLRCDMSVSEGWNKKLEDDLADRK